MVFRLSEKRPGKRQVKGSSWTWRRQDHLARKDHASGGSVDTVQSSKPKSAQELRLRSSVARFCDSTMRRQDGVATREQMPSKRIKVEADTQIVELVLSTVPTLVEFETRPHEIPTIEREYQIAQSLTDGLQESNPFDRFQAQERSSIETVLDSSAREADTKHGLSASTPRLLEFLKAVSKRKKTTSLPQITRLLRARDKNVNDSRAIGTQTSLLAFLPAKSNHSSICLHEHAIDKSSSGKDELAESCTHGSVGKLEDCEDDATSGWWSKWFKTNGLDPAPGCNSSFMGNILTAFPASICGVVKPNKTSPEDRQQDLSQREDQPYRSTLDSQRETQDAKIDIPEHVDVGDLANAESPPTASPDTSLPTSPGLFSLLGRFESATKEGVAKETDHEVESREDNGTLQPGTQRELKSCPSQGREESRSPENTDISSGETPIREDCTPVDDGNVVSVATNNESEVATVSIIPLFGFMSSLVGQCYFVSLMPKADSVGVNDDHVRLALENVSSQHTTEHAVTGTYASQGEATSSEMIPSAYDVLDSNSLISNRSRPSGTEKTGELESTPMLGILRREGDEFFVDPLSTTSYYDFEEGLSNLQEGTDTRQLCDDLSPRWEDQAVATAFEAKERISDALNQLVEISAMARQPIEVNDADSSLPGRANSGNVATALVEAHTPMARNTSVDTMSSNTRKGVYSTLGFSI